MRISHQGKKGADDPRPAASKSDHFRRPVKKGDHLRTKDGKDQTDSRRHHRRTYDAEPGTASGPLRLPCTQILTDKGRYRHCKTRDREEAEALQLLITSDTRDCRTSEAVDVGLYQYIGECDNRILQA